LSELEVDKKFSDPTSAAWITTMSDTGFALRRIQRLL